VKPFVHTLSETIMDGTKQHLRSGVPISFPEGEALVWMGELAILRVTGKETGGRYTLVELWAAKEGEVPWHVHRNEDEAFYILEGEMTIHVGEQTFKGVPGSFVFAPKDIPHMYTVDSPGHARLLMFFSPSGFENFIRATSDPAESLVPPPPADIELDLEQIAALARQYGAEFVEPPEGGAAP
jgi:quercetin dioxygenase-like cupin family protein